MPDPWDVVSVGGAPAGGAPPPGPPPSSAPAAAPSQQDPWAVVGGGGGAPAQPTQPTPGGGLHEGMVDHYLRNAAWWDPIANAVNLTAGIGAGVEQTAAGAARLGRRLIGGDMTAPEKWLQAEAAKPTEGTAQAVGKAGEAAGEFFTGEEALSLLGRAGMALSGADKLKQASQIASLANKVPMIGKLLRIGMETVKSGVTSGAIGAGQEYLKTGGDAEAAAQAGATTGGITAALNLAGGGIGAAGRALADLAPVTKTMEGVPITALKSQVNKAGRFIEGGDISELAPEVAAQQQQAAQHIIGNVASRATSRILDGVNATRRFFGPGETDAARLLPAPEGAQPYTFDLGMRPVTEEGAAPGKFTPESLKSPEEFAAGQKQGEAAADETITELGVKKATGKRLTPEEKTQLAEAQQRYAEPTQALEPHQTNDPAEAISHLSTLQDFRDSSEYGKLSDTQRATFDQRYQTLRDQLDMYHSSPYRNNFAPIDTQSVASQVHTFGQAESQVRASVRPVLQKADQLSGGRIGDLEREVQSAQSAVKNSASDDAFSAATQRLDKANTALINGLGEYSGGMTRGELATARQALNEASQLGTMHSVWEHMMNGVTDEESGQGLSRVMTGNARRLQTWLDNPSNSNMVDRMLGRETRTNMKELSLLMSKVAPQRHMADAAKDIAGIIDKFPKGGFLTKTALMHLVGMEPTTAAAVAGAGLVGSRAMRFVVRQAATNPQVGRMLTYAVNHGVDTKVFAPLIARTIMHPFLQSTEQGTEEPEEQGATQ